MNNPIKNLNLSGREVIDVFFQRNPENIKMFFVDVRTATKELSQLRYNSVDKYLDHEYADVELIDKWFGVPPTIVFLDSHYHFDDLQNDYVSTRLAKYGDDNLFHYFNNTIVKMNRVVEAAKNGAALRLWYGHNATDLCGLMSLLYNLENVECDIIELELDDDTNRICGKTKDKYRSWRQISPDDLCIPISQARLMTEEKRTEYVNKWRNLIAENAEYRILENGELKSADHEYMKKIARKHFPKGRFALTTLMSKLMEQEEAFFDTCVNHVFPMFVLRMVEDGDLENLGPKPNLFVDYWLNAK